MPENAADFDRLTAEFDRLTLEQAQALRSGSVAGMTAADVKGYDARCRKIMRLVKEISVLQKSQQVQETA